MHQDKALKRKCRVTFHVFLISLTLHISYIVDIFSWIEQIIVNKFWGIFWKFCIIKFPVNFNGANLGCAAWDAEFFCDIQESLSCRIQFATFFLNDVQ